MKNSTAYRGAFNPNNPNFARKRQIFGMQCLFDPVKTGLRRQNVVFCLNTGLGTICTQRLKSIARLEGLIYQGSNGFFSDFSCNMRAKVKQHRR